MNHKGTHEAERNRAIAVVRKLARDYGTGRNTRIGPEYLAAGLLKVMGTDADGLLADLGIGTIATGLKRVPDASPDEKDRLPAAQPNQALANLLTGRLKPFIEGNADTAGTLRLLLADTAVVTALEGLVSQLQHRQERAFHPPITDTVRALTRNLQTGYLLGRTYYSPSAKMPLPDYVSGKSESAFTEAVRGFDEERHKVRMAMYSGRRGHRRSVFERYMREFGPVAADVAFAVMINAMTPFTEGGGPISVREVAWALDPLRYHAIAGDVIEAARSLKLNNLIRILPDDDQCQLFSVLLPSERLMDEFTGYISACNDTIDNL